MVEIYAETSRQVGRGICKLRKQKLWSQDMLAKKAGVNRATISLIENGKTNTSLVLLEKLANNLETSVVGLISLGKISRRNSDQSINVIFSTNVRRRRGELALTRKELGERVGFLPQYLSTTENAKRLPTLKNVLKLAAALEVNPSSLFSLEGGDAVPRGVFESTDDVCKRISERRYHKKMSIADVSRQTEIGQSHLSNIEALKVTPSVQTLIAFCNGLGLGLSELLDPK